MSRRRATPRLSRRSAVVLLAALVLMTVTTRTARTEDVPVPVSRQAELIVRVAAHDRNMRPRAAGKVRMLIVQKPDDPDSRNVASGMETALRRFDTVAGLPAEATTIAFPGATELADKIKVEHFAVVYLAPALDPSIADIVKALEGVDVLSVASLPRYVAQAVVLGFDLVSGKPTIIINLAQARRQHVDIDAEALHIMKVIE